MGSSGSLRVDEALTFCPQCGKPVAPTDTFCTACGTEVTHAPAAPGGSAPALATRLQRPVGVGIIAGVMIVLGAFIFLVFAGGLLVARSDPASWSEVVAQVAEGTAIPAADIEPALYGMMIGGIAMALLAIVAGFGALRAKRWAWGLMIAFMALNAVGSILSITSATGILGIVVSAIVIWYFLRPEVKAYFGRS